MERNLLALFHSADGDGNGSVSESEFCKILAHDKVKLWLGKLGIDGGDPISLYQQLAGGHDELACEAFVYGIKRLKGEARAQDLIPVVNDCKRILKICEQMQNSCGSLETLFRSRQVGVANV
mmetsp:Transcript_34482/g.68059  ORF Transcript_34482/g.68059 Transcript_34482/m.68059 type:complete len:122 (-) Transcript_34482:6-371(-)